MKNYIKDILLALTDAGVSYVIAGGVAVVLHGVERVTLDIDIALDMDDCNLKSFLEVVRNLDLVPRAPVPAESLLDPVARDMMVNQKNAIVFTFIDTKDPLRQLDVFLTAECGYNELSEGCPKVEVEGRHLRIASKSKLIEMKKRVQPLRPKDRMDIEELERLS